MFPNLESSKLGVVEVHPFIIVCAAWYRELLDKPGRASGVDQYPFRNYNIGG